jgi:hypothetical protein
MRRALDPGPWLQANAAGRRSIARREERHRGAKATHGGIGYESVAIVERRHAQRSPDAPEEPSARYGRARGGSSRYIYSIQLTVVP